MVMENKELDIITDIVVPAIIIIGLFIINGIILFFIFKKRKTIVYEQYNDTNQDEPTTSQPLCKTAAAVSKVATTEDNEAGIELERL